jgi:hypothetical protein
VARHGYVAPAQRGRGDGPGMAVDPAELRAPPCQVVSDRTEGEVG